MSKESAKEQILALGQKYAEICSRKDELNRYNEEMTKLRFINPLFQALGWDIENKNRRDEVTFEDRISKGRVDYGFKINGIPKFYLEAKSLKVDIDDPAYAKQAIDYAWNKGCPWAILTNFRKVKVFNADIRDTNLSRSQFFEITYDRFADNFDQLSLLSRSAFEYSLLDRQAETWGKKAKKVRVNEQLLSDFTRFRGFLLANIARNNQNKKLTELELDEAVQRILDRLIFIRYAEDKELEPKQLLPNLRQWESEGRGHLIKNLRAVFTYFDKHYNSKIFAKHLCDDLEIDNEILHEIIEGLHFDKERLVFYDFSVIEADVLGNIYEQYLGHILRKTSKAARLTESHTHRKAQGIYYTPTYVVDYIVKNTFGTMLVDKKVDPQKIKLLDPACGSGSFLTKVFDTLNNYYLIHDKNYHQTQLDSSVQTGTYSKKVKILQDNIFGVDIDRQAVEVAQLNLLLRIAEKGQRLPLLQKNIRQGNSLVEDPTIDRDKFFVWEKEFSSIMNEGGFDIILGNPPYEVLIKSENDQNFLDYLKQGKRNHYALNGKTGDGYISAEYNPNLFALFIERSLELLKEKGIIGFIVQNSLFSNIYFKNIRRLILEQCIIKEIVDFRFGVFKDAVVDSTIIILQKESSKAKRDSNKVRVRLNVSEVKDIDDPCKLIIYEQSFFNDPSTDYRFPVYLAPETLSIIKKMNAVRERVRNYVNINRGIGLVSPKDRHKASLFSYHKTTDKDKPVFVGKDVTRYITSWSGNWARIDDKTIAGGTRDYRVHECTEKIIFPRIRNLKYRQRILASLDNKQIWALDNYNILRVKEHTVDLRYILGLLNSKLLNYYFGNVFVDVNIKSSFVESLPIIITTNQHAIAERVDKILSLNEKRMVLKLTDERTKLNEEIRTLDKEIDELVYQTYGISEEEKILIEKSFDSLPSAEE